MKTLIALFTSILVASGFSLQAQNIVGDWTLTSGTYNNSPLQNLSGSLLIYNCPDDTINYNADFTYGNFTGSAEARFTLSGNKFLSNLTGENIPLNGFAQVTEQPSGILLWRTILNITLTAFNQVGGTAILYGDPSFSVSGNNMTIISFDGNTILNYSSTNNTEYTGFGCGNQPAPANNDCETPQEVFLGFDQDFSTLGATTNGPSHPTSSCFPTGSSNIEHDIWYEFTAPNTATVEWSTCNKASWNTRLVVYKSGETCPFSDADIFSCNDNQPTCFDGTSKLTFDVDAGSTYFLRLGGFDQGEFGVGKFDLHELTVSTKEETSFERVIISPNPVINTAKLQFTIKKPSDISIKVLSPLGQSIFNITEGYFTEGDHVLDINTSSLPTGIYFLKISGDEKENILRFVKQ